MTNIHNRLNTSVLSKHLCVGPKKRVVRNIEYVLIIISILLLYLPGVEGGGVGKLLYYVFDVDVNNPRGH